jgi:hypothetical protein
MTFDDDTDPNALSPTALVCRELELYAHAPRVGEPDPRPLPEDADLTGALADMFDALVSTLSETALEPDLEGLLWGTVNLFHRAAHRLEAHLDNNEQAQRNAQANQDGSEVRAVELETLIAQGLALAGRRDAFEFLRDRACELYETHTGSAWRPRTGSRLTRKTLTAALIDSRDFIAARRRAESELLLPAGPKVAFSGGNECNAVDAIWQALDKVRAKHPGMALLHGGGGHGAERIAACWAEARQVAQIAFKPDWARHAKAAPFKRNDAMLEALPIGVIVFRGSGIQDNLADKAKKLGIPVYDFRKRAS